MPISINYIADLTGFDRRTIQKRLRSIPKPPDNLYDSHTALRLIYCPDLLDPSQERAKLDQVRRELAEIQREERLGNLIPADVVLDRWCSEASRIRAKLLNL